MAIAFDTAAGHHSADNFGLGGGNTTITSNIDIVAGQCVVVCAVAPNDTAAPIVTDTYGNNYGAATTNHPFGTGGMSVFVLNGALGGTGGHVNGCL